MDELVQKQYAFRQFMLNHYDKLLEMAEADPKSVKLSKGKLLRFRDIVNQTDPEELFKSISEKDLDKYLSGQAGISNKPPDERVFKRVRVLLEGDLHHAIELNRNRNLIPPTWSNDDIYKFHRTVKQARMQPGSAAGSLAELRKIDHDPQGEDNTPENRARSAHDKGTKQEPFEYTEMDPRMRAAEMIMYNESADYRIRQIEMDPERPSYKAFEEANRLNIEAGGQGFERRTARPSPGTEFTTEPTFRKNASDRLKGITGIGLDGLPKGALKTIPFVGAGLGIISAGQQAIAGDLQGAGETLATTGLSEIAGDIPIVGDMIEPEGVASADLGYPERAAAQIQQNQQIQQKVDEAKKRGGRWNIGGMILPEFGLSERFNLNGMSLSGY